MKDDFEGSEKYDELPEKLDQFLQYVSDTYFKGEMTKKDWQRKVPDRDETIMHVLNIIAHFPLQVAGRGKG